jgi:hypothetical protein
MSTFKAIELDAVSHRRTGKEYVLAAENRQAAIAELLGLLNSTLEAARIDPSRTLVQVNAQLWTIVGLNPAAPAAESPSLRRAGAKHKRVR